MEKAVDDNRAQMDMGLGFVDLQEYYKAPLNICWGLKPQVNANG